jgi:YggT family protein
MPNLGGVDISPVILILALYFIQRVLLNILISLSSAGY